MKVDTSETEGICKFDDSAPCNYKAAIIRDKLYFITTDCNPTFDEFGNVGSSASHDGLFFLCSIDLKTHEYKNYGVIYDGDRQYEAAHHSSSAIMLGCIGDKIILHYSFIKEMFDAQSFKNGEPEFTHLTIEFDSKTGEISEPSDRNIMFINGEDFGYIENGRSYLSRGGEVTELSCDVSLGDSAFDNKLFKNNDKKWIDLADMSEHSMGEYEGYSCVDEYKGSYIIKRGANAVKLTEDELLALGKE